MVANTFVTSASVLSSIRLVVIHGGMAHEDELLGAALILAKVGTDVRLERRDPTPEEMADPTVVKLDIGKQYVPESSALDHHQSKDLPCAAVLAGEWLGVKDDLLGAFQAIGMVDEIDRNGPFAVAKKLGIDPQLIFRLQSPLAGALKGMFERCKGTVPQHLVELLREIGKDFLSRAERFGKDLTVLKALKTFTVKGLKAVRLPDKEPNDLRGTPALQAYLDAEGVNIFVNLSRDNKSLQVTRVNDHPKVDFGRLKGGPIQTDFVHVNGFTAVLKNESDLDAALEIAIAAV